MTLTPSVRRFVLAVHVGVSVGWIGAVMAYLPLDVAAATSQDPQTLRAAYLAMDLIAWRAVVPLAFASFLTGLVIALGTKWGLFRHYWVLISLLLTIVAVVVLVAETRVIGHFADVAADPRTSDDALRALGNTLPHSVGGAVVLVVVMALNIYKPRGLTPYGWRKQRAAAQESTAQTRDPRRIQDP